MLGNGHRRGFSAAGNIWFVVLALTQILNVGTAAMVSHAVGAQQHERANLVFNQSLMLSGVHGRSSCSSACMRWPGPYMRTGRRPIAMVAQAGIDYLYWLAPGLGMQFLMIAMFATLRGTGIVKPTMILQMITVGS